MIHDDDLRARIHDALDGVYRPAPGLLRRSVDAAARSGRAPRVRALVVAAALSAVVAAVVVLTLLQHQLSRGTNGPVQSPTPAPQHVLYTLDAQNAVSALDAETLRVLWRRSAAPPPPAVVQPTGLLALSADRRTLWVLAVSDAHGGGVLHSYDAATGAPGATIALAGGAVYSALATDRSSGELAAVGRDSAGIVVTLVDPGRNVVLSTTVMRPLPAAVGGGSGVAVDAVFTGDGSRLYYSYGGGGGNSDGVDWAAVAHGQVQPCRPQAAGDACAPGLAVGVALAGSDALGADTGNPQMLVELAPDGTVLRRFPTGLTPGGADGLVVSVDQATATVLGECANGGGITRLDLGRGTTQAIATAGPVGAPPDAATPCGSRPVLLPGGDIAASLLATASASPNTPGTVAIIDPATGRIVRQASLPAEVADLVAGP